MTPEATLEARRHVYPRPTGNEASNRLANYIHDLRARAEAAEEQRDEALLAARLLTGIVEHEQKRSTFTRASIDAFRRARRLIASVRSASAS